MRRTALLLALITSPHLAGDEVIEPASSIVHRQTVQASSEPIELPASGQKWVRIRSRHYDVISSAGEKRTSEIVRNLETLAATLIRATSRFERPSVPTTVFVFAKRRDSQPYFDLLGESYSRAAGVYVRHDDGSAMFIDAERPRFERTAMHELTHDLLPPSEMRRPLWLEEGLAEYFANASFDRGTLVAGLPVDRHAALLSNAPLRTFAEVEAVRPGSAAASSPRFYAQSWAAVDWLMRIDQDAFWRFLAAMEMGTPMEVALRAEFGRTIDDLELGMRSILPPPRRRVLPVETIARVPERLSRPVRFERLDSSEEPPAPELIDQTTLLFELARLLSYIPGAEAEAERHYDAAVAAERAGNS